MNKLILGDCLEKMKDIPDGSVDMILCDLPYGTSSCKWDSVIPFEPLWEQYNRIIKDNGAIVLFGSEPFSSKLRMSNLKMYKYDWIWEKNSSANFLNSSYQPLKIHEIISVFGKKACSYTPQGSMNYFPIMAEGKPYVSVNGNKHFNNVATIRSEIKKINKQNNGTRYPKSIQTFNLDKNKIHPTQKPVALLEYLIKTYTQEGETVLDNCMGSGSTGVACVNTNRNFIGIELDEKYFEIASQRIVKAMEDKAVEDKWGVNPWQE